MIRTRSDLIAELERNFFTEKEARAFLRAFTDCIKNDLMNGEMVCVPNLGRLEMQSVSDARRVRSSFDHTQVVPMPTTQRPHISFMQKFRDTVKQGVRT